MNNSGILLKQEYEVQNDDILEFGLDGYKVHTKVDGHSSVNKYAYRKEEELDFSLYYQKENKN